ncbi:MAG: methylcobamide--CoM methyltransferase [Candidatus Zixiibacteriota bacterium]
MLKTTVVGSYPKITEDKSAVNLRQARNRFDLKKISAEELEKAYRDTIKRVIREQEEAGVDLITDGQIRWDDPVTPFARNIDGMEIGGLLRFFDNNVYYRRPVIKSKLSFKDYSVVNEFKFAQANSKREVKPVMVGAFTFAQLSRDEFYHDEEKLVFDLAEILHREAEKLSEVGAKTIQIDEPSLCFHPEKLRLVKESLKIITGGIEAKFALYLYFGSIEKLVPGLFDLPVDIVGVDVVSRAENLELLVEHWGQKDIGLGCVDARNTKMESESELLALFEKVTRKIPENRIFINPSCGLEFLPHAVARDKLKKMAEAARKFGGEKEVWFKTSEESL